jgi:hypothetical protein
VGILAGRFVDNPWGLRDDSEYFSTGQSTLPYSFPGLQRYILQIAMQENGQAPCHVNSLESRKLNYNRNQTLASAREAVPRRNTFLGIHSCFATDFILIHFFYPQYLIFLSSEFLFPFDAPESLAIS